MITEGCGGNIILSIASCTSLHLQYHMTPSSFENNETNLIVFVCRSKLIVKSIIGLRIVWSDLRPQTGALTFGFWEIMSCLTSEYTVTMGNCKIGDYCLSRGKMKCRFWIPIIFFFVNIAMAETPKCLHALTYSTTVHFLWSLEPWKLLWYSDSFIRSHLCSYVDE